MDKMLLNPFSFELPTTIEYGAGSLLLLPEKLRSMKVSRVLIVSDEGLKRTGLIDKVTDLLEKDDLKWDLFTEVEPNPKDYNVERGAEKARESGSDCIVALGGGSPIDCAKGIALLATHGGRIREYEDRSRIGEKVLPLIAIPTTAGTGSEVTFGAVITDTAEWFKFTVKSPVLGARIALIDPEMTLGMPPALTASTGMDALTHAIEGYTAKNAEPIGDGLALYAIELIHKYLPRAFRNGNDLEARAGMILGSVLAGIAFSHSDVAAVHCIAEALGGKYDLPHGVCNAVVLAPMMEYNMDFCREKYARVASAMGFSFDSVEEGSRIAVRETMKLAEEVQLPSFSSLGILEKDLEELAANSARNGSNRDNPRPMNKDDYLGFLKDLLKKG